MNNKKNWPYSLWIALILILAYGLRVLDTAHRSLWFDEAVETLTANSPFLLLPKAVVRWNYQPPLTAYVLHIWSQISIHPLWLRYLPLVFSMFAIVGIIMLTRIVVGRRASLVAGLITAIMPTEIYYAQDVGEYSLLVCFVTWSLFFLYLAYENNHWRNWILWGMFCVLAMYVQYGAAIFFAPLALITIIYHIWFKRWQAVKRQALILIGIFIAILPLLIYFLPKQSRRVDDTVFASSFAGFYLEGKHYLEGFGHIFTFNLIGWPFSPISKWIGLVILIVIAVLLLIFFQRIKKRPFLWLIAVYSFYFVLVRLGLYPVFGSRQSLFFTPFLILVIALVFDQLWQRKLHVLAILFVGILISVEIYSSPQATLSLVLRDSPPWSPVEEIDDPFEYWHNRYQAHQTTFVNYGAVPAFRYYLLANGLDVETKNILEETCSLEQRSLICEKYNLFYGTWTRSLPNDEEVESMLKQMGGSSEQFWLFFSHTPVEEQEEILFYLQKQYQIIDKYTGEGAAVFLLSQH